MHQDGRDDLRMLVLDHLGDGRAVEPLQPLDRAGVAACQDTIEEQVRLVGAERLGQHVAQIGVGVDVERGLCRGFRVKALQHLVDLLAREVAERGHGLAQLLHLARRQMLEHLGGFLLAQREQQDGAFGEPFVSHGPSP